MVLKTKTYPNKNKNTQQKQNQCIKEKQYWEISSQDTKRQSLGEKGHMVSDPTEVKQILGEYHVQIIDHNFNALRGK